MLCRSLVTAAAIALAAPSLAQDRMAALKQFDAEITQYLAFSNKVKAAARNDTKAAETDLDLLQSMRLAQHYNEGLERKIRAVAIPNVLAAHLDALVAAQEAAAEVVSARATAYYAGASWADDKKASQLASMRASQSRADGAMQRYRNRIESVRRRIASAPGV